MFPQLVDAPQPTQTMNTPVQLNQSLHQRPLEVGPYGGDYAERVLGGVLATMESLSDGVLDSMSGGPDRKGLLRALVYCYATGIYASSEIESALNDDPNVRFLTGGERYESGQIRQFRRRNITLIRRLLAQALRLTKQPGGLPLSRVDDHFRWSMEWMAPSLGQSRFEEEAATLIRRAICDDTALLDE
jgi:hypothetical protein